MTDLFDPAPARADHATAAARLLLPAIAGDAKITRAMLNDAMIRAYGGTDADGHWTQRESFEVLEHATALAVCAAGTTPAVDAAIGLMARLPTQTVRSEEQIELLRLLWTQESVDFKGQYHKVTNAGINPLPVQRPIPIWLGGGEDRVIRRIGKMADGWFPQFQPDSAGQEKIAEMREHATKAGRDPKAIGIEGRVAYATDKQEDWEKMAAAWDEAGATHLSVNTMRAGLKGPDQHIEAIKRFKETVSG